MPSNAGEVGDGPDQGHSGGDDSVPPAPKFSTSAINIRASDCRSTGHQAGPKHGKKAPAQRAHSRRRPLCLLLNLRLCWLGHFGPEEHGPETRESGPDKIDCGRSTFRNLLAIPLIRFASLMVTSVVVTESNGSQTTNHDDCQPPSPPTVAHVILPAISEPTSSGEYRGSSLGFFFSFLHSTANVNVLSR